MNFSKIFFLCLTVLASILFVWPELNFQDVLAQGDHGRDLYAFEVVYKHQLPYKDFWWVYGPIMPYYYGLFYKIFGLHISSILIGRAFLLLACSVFFYLSCAVLMPPSLACLASLWFLEGRQEFICTYNHLGGTLASLVIIYALFSYIYRGSMKYLWISLCATFFLMLVKINFGIISLLGILIYLPVINWLQKYTLGKNQIKFLFSALIALPLATLLIYWYLLKDLPAYAIHQCLPYFGDDQPYHSSPVQAMASYLHGQWQNFWRTREDFIIGLIFQLSTIIGACLLLASKTLKDQRKNIGLCLILTVTFFIFYFHEFLMSNVWYRSFWSYPFLILFEFIMISTVFRFLHPALRILTILFFWKLVIFGGLTHIQQIQDQKTPDHYLNMPRGQVYVGNETAWVDTVNKTTDFMAQAIPSSEVFFALPYDCLYYYLAGKPSPTRQLIFFDHIKIPQEQEISVIKDLEDHHVNYVVMSTRIASMEMDLGIFGKTYCPLLAQYLAEHFTQIYQQGGDPERSPGWADNHGIFILKRNIK
jgi:hypothetical protein